jgi:hypothetical protein
MLPLPDDMPPFIMVLSLPIAESAFSGFFHRFSNGKMKSAWEYYYGAAARLGG